VTYIFYDTETTGLTAGFDQILQFAALVTDDDLNVVEEINLRCRLQSHVMASPGALVITGMRPSEIEQAPLSHYEMIRAIRALVERHTPTTMVGFNSLGYDEGMLRQAFYQTLNPTYLTNTGGNTRMDMLRVAHAASQYAPDVLTIPITAEGRRTFRLGLLAAANGLLHDHAHDAMSDTLATLELARLIRDKAPKVWEALCQTSSKKAAGDFIADNEMFWFTDMAFGTPTILATSIAANPENPSEVAVFDLGHDPAAYQDVDYRAVPALLKASPRPIRIVKLNSQPILMPVGMAPATASTMEMDIARDRVRQIAENTSFAKEVGQAVASRYPHREPELYVEQRIYEGFPSRADSNLMERFHTVPWKDRLAIVSRLADVRLTELGERLIYVEAPEILPDDAREYFDAWRVCRLNADQAAPWVSLISARNELEKLKTTATEDVGGLLEEIEAYLDQVSNEISTARAGNGAETVILEVGGEGGSIKLLAKESDEGWVFKVSTGESGLLDDDEDYAPPVRPWAKSWDEAVQQLDQYPWSYLYPLEVHPDFRTRVEQALVERVAPDDKDVWSRWSVLREIT
jgi:exodeoxyribonuclease I